MSALTSPSLTSVGIPLVNCGRAGVDMLLSLVREPSAPPTHHHDLSFHLVVRDSTGPATPTAPRRTTARTLEVPAAHALDDDDLLLDVMLGTALQNRLTNEIPVELIVRLFTNIPRPAAEPTESRSAMRDKSFLDAKVRGIKGKDTLCTH